MSDRKTDKPASPLTFNFFAVEFILFAAQTLALYIVAFFISDLLSNEERLTEFITSKLAPSSSTEFFLTLFALTFCLGLVTIVQRLFSGKFVEAVTEELLHELPRTFYLFGSTITAVTLAASTYLLRDSSPQSAHSYKFLAMSVLFAVIFFAYGCGLKALLVNSRHRMSAKKATPDPALE